eukprot:Selendium_serpulae@DN5359_c0_g1_i3.p3
MLGSPHGVFAEVPLCGDIGAIVEPHKHVYVTGRVKELIITAGGENVSPGVAEALVLDLLPFVSQCVVLGDRRPFVAALLTLKEERVAQSSADSDSPVFELPSQLIDLLRARGSAVTTAAEATVAQDEALWEIIQAGLDKVNKKLASRYAACPHVAAPHRPQRGARPALRHSADRVVRGERRAHRDAKVSPRCDQPTTQERHRRDLRRRGAPHGGGTGTARRPARRVANVTARLTDGPTDRLTFNPTAPPTAPPTARPSGGLRGIDRSR